MIITELYRQLFGKTKLGNGNVIDMAEHGRVGGVSTGQPFKHTSIVDKDSGEYLAVSADGSIGTYLIPFTTWVTTAVTLTDANTAYLLPTTEQVGRKVLVVYNVSDTSLYFGGPTVTVATGILLASGSVLTIDAEGGVYAVCGSSGKIINALEGK